MSQNGAKLFSEPEAEVVESESICSDSLATCTINPVQFKRNTKSTKPNYKDGNEAPLTIGLFIIIKIITSLPVLCKK